MSRRSFGQLEQELSDEAEFENITNLSEALNEESKADSPDQINHLKNEPLSNDTKHGNVEYQFDQSQQQLLNQQILTCDYQATTQSYLKQHIQSKHEGVKYPCNHCDYKFTSQGSLTRHIQSVHEGIKYSCNQCDYQATEKGNLTKHFKRKHS